MSIELMSPNQTNATLYSAWRGNPTREQLAQLAPGATISITNNVALVRWPDATLICTPMPDQEIPKHLEGFRGWLKHNNFNEALQTRVLATLSVFGCVIESNGTHEGVNDFLFSMTAATDGLLFTGNALFDAEGRDLFDDPLGPPPAERVVMRAKVLLTLAVRGLLEEDAGKEDESKAEQARQGLAEWAKYHPGFFQEADEGEQQVILAPIGQLPKQVAINAVWRAEGAQVLLWALGARELPAYDSQEHPYKVAYEIGINRPDADTPAQIKSPQLRAENELIEMQKTLLLIHWRMMEFRIRPGLVDMKKQANNPLFSGANFSLVTLGPDHDLMINGATISQADRANVGLVQSISMERHHAANWLIGEHHDYNRVVTPT